MKNDEGRLPDAPAAQPYLQTHRSAADSQDADLRWELRGRLHAVLEELDERPADWDVVRTLLSGAVESIDAAWWRE
jgi:hypothetical protein